MRHFCVLLSLCSCFASAAVARAASVSAADLAALDRLECFSENPLIEDENDMVVLAILPADADLLRVHGPRLTFRPSPNFQGTLIESDLSALHEEVMRGPSATPPVLRLSLNRPPADRGDRRRYWALGIADLRARLPGVHLRCVYDLVRWMKARACIEDLVD